MWNSAAAEQRLIRFLAFAQSPAANGLREALFLHHAATLKANSGLRDFEMEALAQADRILQNGGIVLTKDEIEHFVERRLKGIFILGVVVGLLGLVPEPMKHSVQGTDLVNTILVSPN